MKGLNELKERMLLSWGYELTQEVLTRIDTARQMRHFCVSDLRELRYDLNYLRKKLYVFQNILIELNVESNGLVDLLVVQMADAQTQTKMQILTTGVVSFSEDEVNGLVANAISEIEDV